MQQGRLGRSPLIVSRLGLGLAALGRPGYITVGHGRDLGDTDPAAMERHCHAVLDAARAAGVRYFDAARSYGRAEAFLASWLGARDVPPGAVTIGSKWGYTYTAGWRVSAEKHEVKDHSLAAFRRQLAETRALLGEHLALYQIHSVTPDSPVLDDGPVLDELARLRDSGVLVGLSLSGPRQAEVLDRARAVRAGGAPLFGCVQATWNLLERSCERALVEAHAAGMGVIVKEALANGRLARSPPGALSDAAAACGTTPSALAIAAALAQPWADVVLSGAATIAQLEDNVSSASIALEPHTRQAIDALVEDPARYWTERAALPWN
jgi:aryl-alcohol dehydrogenase-like predicted oxidoreductase